MSEIDDRLDRLESQLDQQQQQIDDQQATIEDQQDRIESQQATIEAQREEISDLQDDDSTAATEAESTVLNRRNALKAGGLLALLFGSAGTASADSQGQVGTSSDPLNALYTDEVRDGTDATHLRVNDGGPLGVDRDLRLNGGNSILDASDNAHLTVNNGGTLGLNQTLDTNGNGITDSSGTVSLKSGLDANGVAASGTLDVQSGTVTNSTDSLTITTGDGNLNLNPDNNVYLSGNQLTGVRGLLPSGPLLSVFGPINIGSNYITEGTVTPDSGTIRLEKGSAITWAGDLGEGSIRSDNNGRLVLDTANPDGEVSISAPDTGDVSASELDDGRITFAVDTAGPELDVYVNDGATTGSATVASYSTERLKTGLRTFEDDPEDILDIRPRTFQPGDGDGRQRLGITAESAHDAGLDHLVEYAPVEDAWQTAEGIDEEYLMEYGVERDGKKVVPNDIRERAWLAMHHELLRDFVATVEQKDEKIEDLEAETDRLCDRVSDLEDQLGVDPSGSRQKVADD